MAIIVNDRPVSIPSGQQSFGTENVPDALTVVLFTLRYCTTATPTLWPNANTVIRTSAWQSNDGGTTWMHRSTMSSFGGIHVVKGVEDPETTWGFTLIPGLNRQIRVDVEVENGPLNTRIDLVVI